MDRDFYGIYYDRLLATETLMREEVEKMLFSLGSDSETALAEHLKCRIKGAERAIRRLGTT